MATISYIPVVIVLEDDTVIVDQYCDADGNAIDLTHYTLAAEIEWTGGVISLTEGNGRVVRTDSANGIYELRLPHAAKSGLPSGQRSHITVWTIDNATGDQETLYERPVRVIAR
jgi:hypothetical protein